MNRSLHFSGLFMVPLFFVSFLLFAQENAQKKDCQPEPGQDGKDVRWFPTPQLLVDKMLDMAQVTPEDILVDLGSGDGRMVISAAKRGLHAIGIEYNPDMIRLSRENAIEAGVADKVEFIEADLFKYDFTGATVITMFLLPEINLRLRPKLFAMNPGTKIISNTFKMQNWQYDDSVKVEDNTSRWTNAFLWIVPAKVGGTWEFKSGTIEMSQEFQMVSGKIDTGGETIEILKGRIHGYDIVFTVEGISYKCKIEGNKMNGSVANGGKATSWEATRLQ